MATNKKMPDYATDSPYALQHFDAFDPQGLNVLNSSLGQWFASLEDQKWVRALQWFENASYLQGNHYTQFLYNPSSGQFGLRTLDGSQGAGRGTGSTARVADNRLIRPTETVVSMLTQHDLTGRVTPNSDRADDVDAAALAEVVLQLLWEKPLYMPQLLDTAAKISLMCGTAFAEVFYGETDIPVTIPKIKMVKTANPFYDPEDKEGTEAEFVEEPQEAGEEVAFKQDIQANVWTPFHMVVDPAATDEIDMTWIARRTFEDIDNIVRKFTGAEADGFLFDDPVELKGSIQQDTGTRHPLYWWSRLQDILETPHTFQGGAGLAPQTDWTSSGHAPNQTILSVIDVKPSLEYPRGRTLVQAGTTIVWAGDARAWTPKFPERWHPYAIHHWFHIPGKFWGVPLLSFLLPLQKKINAIDALVHQNRMFMTLGQWLVPNHTKIPDGYFSGFSGEQVPYNALPNMPGPEKVGHIPLPGELLAERGQLLEAIDYIAASGIVGGEIAPSAARAGAILEFLKAEKLRSKTPMLKSWERFIETLASGTLIEVQAGMQAADESLLRRVATAARDHSDLQINEFSGADLRDHYQVKIDVVGSVVHSPEALQAKALEYFTASQGQVPPTERSAILEILGMDVFMTGAESGAVMRARRMISRIQAGNLDTAFPQPGVDVPGPMAEVFRAFMQTEQWNQMSETNEEGMNAILSLYDHWTKLEEERQMAEMQMMMMMGGQQ